MEEEGIEGGPFLSGLWGLLEECIGYTGRWVVGVARSPAGPELHSGPASGMGTGATTQ